MESSRLRKDSRRGPNQRSNAPIHHVTGRLHRDKAGETRTHASGAQDRTSGDEGSSVRVVADPFGDRCSTGECLLPVRPYEALERIPAGTPYARGYARSVSLAAKTHACENESREMQRTASCWKFKRCESILFREARVLTQLAGKLVAQSLGSVTKQVMLCCSFIRKLCCSVLGYSYNKHVKRVSKNNSILFFMYIIN